MGDYYEFEARGSSSVFDERGKLIFHPLAEHKNVSMFETTRNRMFRDKWIIVLEAIVQTKSDFFLGHQINTACVSQVANTFDYRIASRRTRNQNKFHSHEQTPSEQTLSRALGFKQSMFA